MNCEHCGVPWSDHKRPPELDYHPCPYDHCSGSDFGEVTYLGNLLMEYGLKPPGPELSATLQPVTYFTGEILAYASRSLNMPWLELSRPVTYDWNSPSLGNSTIGTVLKMHCQDRTVVWRLSAYSPMMHLWQATWPD